ncbi:MAG TPA: hypothetical protein DCX06_03935 [Opitutae bacterium]|nr:hypothetical protein [Opitutae bacterium]
MIDLSNAEIVLMIACGLLIASACVYLWKDRSDEDEWKASSLRRPAAPPQTTKGPAPKADTTKNDATNPLPSHFQRFVEYPVFLGYGGFALGALIPMLLILIVCGDAIEDTRYELIVFYGILLLWNISFTQLFKFRLKLPIFPIPIIWALIPLAGIGIWDLAFGVY